MIHTMTVNTGLENSYEEENLRLGYKLMRKMNDGFSSLFIGKRKRYQLGETYEAEEIPTQGYAFRPGFHVLAKPEAPHLKVKDNRVWCKVLFTTKEEIKRPEAQGGLWYLADKMKIIGEVVAT